MLEGHIEAFIEIVRSGGVRRAAEQMSISQPALTARLQGLETQLGARLFRRTPTGMELTPAGHAFLPYAERATEAIRVGSAAVRELDQGVVGELSIGAAPAVGAYVLPELLALFSAVRPNIRLLVKTGHSEEIIDLVVHADVDIGIVRELKIRGSSRPLYEDELVLVVPASHPFAVDGEIDVAEMRDAQLILFDRTSSYYDLTNALFRDAGVSPRGVIELDNIEAAKRMVARGLGVALLPGTAVADSLVSGSLERVRLRGTRPIRRRIVAVERRGPRVQSPVVAGFASLLDQIPELIPGAQRITTDS